MTLITDPDEFTAYCVNAFSQNAHCASIVAGALTANRTLLIATGVRAHLEGAGEIQAMQIAYLSESEARDFAAKILAPFNERN